MRKRLLIFALLATNAIWAAEPIYTLDFRAKDAVKGLRADWWQISSDGRSARSTRFMGGFSLPQMPPLAKDVRISFAVRYFGPEPNAKDHHWGWRFSDANGNSILDHTRGSGMQFDMTTPRGKLRKRAGGGKTSFARKDAAGEPVPVKVTVDLTDESYVVRVDGEACVQERFNVKPMKGLAFYTHHEAVEFADFRVEPLAAKPPVKTIEEPVLVLSEPATGRVTFVSAPFSRQVGGWMAWVKMTSGQPALRFLDAKGDATGTLFLHDFPSFSVATDGKPIDYKRSLPGLFDSQWSWYHIAFTWNELGDVRYYLNGIPYNTGFTAGERFAYPIGQHRLGETVAVEFPDNVRRLQKGLKADAVRDFRVYHRPLSGRDVIDAYRERMPVDVVFENSVHLAGVARPVAFTVAPGGTFMKPSPVQGLKPNPATVDIVTRVEKIVHHHGDPTHPWRITKREFPLAANGVATNRGVRVDAAMTVKTSPVTLEPGDYRLIVSVNGHDRSLFFSAASEVDLTREPATKEEWKKVRTIWERTFTSPDQFVWTDGTLKRVTDASCGPYMEGGTRNFFVATFAPEDLGHPCLVEYVWPDDKPRSMGLYLYPLGGSGNRDRLQGGIQAGAEFPSTGRLQTTSYLIFPTKTNELFEIRTMVASMPAAIASVRISRLAEPLPRLKVHTPEGMAGRKFGHVDEDQTFYTNLNADLHGGTAGVVEELLRYFAYTGQNDFLYSITRYTYTYGPVEGSAGNGMFPFRQGELGYVFETLKRHGVDFIGRLSLSNVPELMHVNRIDNRFRERGWITLDWEGNDRSIYTAGDCQGNPANPETQRAFLAYFDDLVRTSATNGLAGVCFELMGYGSWKGLDMGYDDLTVRRFSRATGIKVDLPIGQRYDYLTSTNTPAIRAKWLAWRAGIVTDFVRTLFTRFKSYNPEMRCFLTVPSDPEKSYVEYGIDHTALAKIPGVSLALSRGAVERWGKFRGGNDAKRTAGADARLFSPTNAALALAKARYGAVPLVVTEQVYFETPTPPPVKGYDCVFQDADIKPWGRYFLKEFAFTLAFGDALEQVVGNQPLGSFGREAEVREWTQAYCALPAQPFKEMGTARGVVGRYLETANGTYFYVVNPTDTPQRVTLDFAKGRKMGLMTPKYVDLSTDEELSAKTVELKPFQLRSFLVPDKRFAFGFLK